jgi:hypothetical protein
MWDGREVLIVRGVCEGRVTAGELRSSRVRRDVFPAPLGPSRRNVGSAVRAGERKMRKCSRVGMERTTTKVRRMVDGVGSRREEIMAEIFAGDIFPSLPLSPSLHHFEEW